jgi:hypothetical protein
MVDQELASREGEEAKSIRRMLPLNHRLHIYEQMEDVIAAAKHVQKINSDLMTSVDDLMAGVIKATKAADKASKMLREYAESLGAEGTTP